MARPTSQPRSFPFLTVFVVLGLSAYAVFHLRAVLAPFFLSIALAYLLNPVINWMESQGLRREAAVVLFYIVVAGALTVAAQQVLPGIKEEFLELKQHLPAYLDHGQEALLRTQAKVLRWLPVEPVAAKGYTDKIYEPIIAQIQNVPSYLVGLFPFLSLFFLIPFITFFLLLDWHNILSGFIQLVPGRYVEQTLYLISEVETSLGNYLRGATIVVAAVGTASYVGLRILGIKYSIAIAALSGLASFIPYMGAILGAGVGCVAAWVQTGSILAGLKVVLLFTGIRLADEAFVQPVVSKHAVKLHPLVYLLSLMVGGELFGFVGLVFAVPAACIIKALLKVGWEWYTTEGYLVAPPLEGESSPYT
ncbi:MAG: AI-2E family transporter [Elusimicrobia bacterium]|nr:AI-2E family transporter [Elusimicrobiota bacterium]